MLATGPKSVFTSFSYLVESAAITKLMYSPFSYLVDYIIKMGNYRELEQLLSFWNQFVKSSIYS